MSYLIVQIGKNNDSKNKQIIIHTIYYIQSTKRFERRFSQILNFFER